jgi:hypothetical protein
MNIIHTFTHLIEIILLGGILFKVFHNTINTTEVKSPEKPTQYNSSVDVSAPTDEDLFLQEQYDEAMKNAQS